MSERIIVLLDSPFSFRTGERSALEGSSLLLEDSRDRPKCLQRLIYDAILEGEPSAERYETIRTVPRQALQGGQHLLTVDCGAFNILLNIQIWSKPEQI